MSFARITRRDAAVYGMACLYIAITFFLMVQKHDAFNTRIHDFARFSQAIWNTLDGQFLYTSLSERSILGDHFSPIMALAAPLLWIWPDERVLFLVQAVNVAAAGVILYYLMREKRPEIAPLFALVFFLNPAVHEVTLFEFRRIVFGMPWLALALYGLVTGRRQVMLAGLLIALLAKESIAIYTAMIGVYLLVFERDWRWGSGLVVLGGLWAWLIGDVVILLFNTGQELYPQLYYYDHIGASYSDIIWVALSDPIRFLQTAFGPAQLQALGRVLLPLAFLVVLDLRVALITAPYFALMFLSNDVDMMQLDKWYTTSITPVFFAAIVSGWHHLPKKWERPAIGLMLACTMIGYVWYGYGPLGGRFDPTIYQPDERDQLRHALIDHIPADASVVSHPIFIPHLTHLNEIHHYLFAENSEVDYILMDQQLQFTPFGEFELRDEVMNLLNNPQLTVVAEADGLFLLSTHTTPQPSYTVGKTAEGGIHLERIELAFQNKQGFYQPLTDETPILKGGDTVRVYLYWEALESDIQERTVSIRISGKDGSLLTQQDQLPAQGFRPMSWWENGTQVRDIYYLTIPENTADQTGSLDITLYDTYTQEPVPFENEGVIMPLLPVEIMANWKLDYQSHQ